MPPGGEERRHRRPIRTAAQAAASGVRGPAGGAGPRRARRPAAVDAAGAAAAGGPQGWDCLPHTCLQLVFDSLDLRDLAAAASVCHTWRYEASLDSRWRAFWQRSVSDLGLWRWAKADGGYRQQLRAKHLVRRGDCVASVFPFSRRDGPVSEVLFFDGGPSDGDKRILTVQHPPKVAGHSVRQRGSCLKVWSAAALLAQRPLLVAHDVLKHQQLEDGRLFLWRIADDAVVPAPPPDAGDPGAAAEAARWAEHLAIVASVLEPGAPSLRDVSLAATFGRGMAPAEWLDMGGGLVAASLLVPSQGRLHMRLFDLASGACLRAATQALHADEAGVQLQDHEVAMVATRSGEVGGVVVATCALFDTSVFLWRLRDAAGPPAAPAPAPPTADAVAWDAAAAPPAAAGGGGEGCGELRRVYSTQDEEPIVDLSISHTGQRLLVVCMEHVFVADLSGVPFLRLSLAQWPGVAPPNHDMLPMDVGAFSWPLPNSTKVAFFLEATNTLHMAEFRRPTMADYWFLRREGNAGGGDGGAGRHPHLTVHAADVLQAGAADAAYFVQSHTDLRPPPSAPPLATLATGRAAGPRAAEPGLVEYTQDGGVLMTTADASCPAVAALLGHEKAAGTYLPGLSAAAGGRARRGPAIVRGGRVGRGVSAPRALVLIDTASGQRYKAVPLDGVCESLHCAGQYVALALADLDAYPDGLAGSLAVLDFGGRGLGAELPAAAATPQPGAPEAQQQQQQQQQRDGRGRRRRSVKACTDGESDAEEKGSEEGQQPRRGARRAKPAVGDERGGSRRRNAADTDDEAGLGSKRGRR